MPLRWQRTQRGPASLRTNVDVGRDGAAQGERHYDGRASAERGMSRIRIRLPVRNSSLSASCRFPERRQTRSLRDRPTSTFQTITVVGSISRSRTCSRMQCPQLNMRHVDRPVPVKRWWAGRLIRVNTPERIAHRATGDRLEGRGDSGTPLAVRHARRS